MSSRPTERGRGGLGNGTRLNWKPRYMHVMWRDEVGG